MLGKIEAFRVEAFALLVYTKLFLDDGMGLLGAAVTYLGFYALDEQPDFAGFPAAKRANT